LSQIPNPISARASVLAIPLGGLGEFGMNMMAYRTGDDILVVDAGLMFPEEELLGVDVVLPDITYLKQNLAMIRAIVLTHAHEDHIGALPYIMPELNVPVYGSRFTLALLRKKLTESGHLADAVLREMVPGEKISIGAFVVEPIHVTHSTVDCLALAIRTPAGVVIICRSIYTRLQDTGRRECWRCSATAPMPSAPAIRHRSAPCARSSRRWCGERREE
jgi:ribonuclease J